MSYRIRCKKGKKICLRILSFLDKVVARRNHEGNYEAEENDELSVRDTETSTEDGNKEQIDIETRRALEKTKTENANKNTNEESQPKKKKTVDVPGEILNILKTKKNTPTEDIDDDKRYLLSFHGDMKKMTHLQKIYFTLGMMQLLKTIFNGNANISSPYYINSTTPSPPTMYTPIYQQVSRSSSAQTRYSGTSTSGPHTVITIPRPSARTRGVIYDTDSAPNVIINSLETYNQPTASTSAQQDIVENISSGQQSNAHGNYYDQPTASTSETDQNLIYDECKQQISSYLTFK